MWVGGWGVDVWVQHLNVSALLSTMDSGSGSPYLRFAQRPRHWPGSLCWWVKDAVHRCWAGKRVLGEWSRHPCCHARRLLV